MIEQSTSTHSGRNVFHVFADRLRRRSATGLAGQAIVAGAAAGLIVVAFPVWWPVAAGVAAICLAAVWGMIDRKHGMSHVRLLPRAIAILTAGLVLLSAVGIALAAFTGDSRSPYGACYGSDGRAFACDATGAPR